MVEIYTYSEEPRKKYYCIDCGTRIQDWHYKKTEIPVLCKACKKDEPRKQEYYKSKEYKEKLRQFWKKRGYNV